MIVDNEGKIFENRRKNKDRRRETVKIEENRRKQTITACLLRNPK